MTKMLDDRFCKLLKGKICEIISSFSYIIIFVLLSSSISEAYGQENPICERKTLKIGVEEESVEPFLFTKLVDGQTRKIGLDMDLIKQVLLKECPDLRVDWKMAPFHELFNRLRDEQFDLIISAITIDVPDKERDSGISYSHPYYKDAGLTLAIKRNNGVKDELDIGLSNALKNKVIYLKKGTTSQKYAEKHNYRFKYPKEPGAGIEKVFSFADQNGGRIIIYDYPSLFYLLEIEKKFSDWEIYKRAGQRYFLTEEQYGIGVREEDRQLLSDINQVLDQHINDIKKLEDKWFNNSNIPVQADFAKEPAIQNAENFVIHISSVRDVLSKFIIDGSFNLTNKEVDETTFIGSLKWEGITFYRAWIGPDAWYYNFISDYKYTAGPSITKKRSRTKGEKTETTINSLNIDFISTKFEATMFWGKLKPFFELDPIGYTILKTKEANIETGVANFTENPAPRGTYTISYGATIPVIDNKVSFEVKHQIIYPWRDFLENEIERSVTLGIQIFLF